MSQKTRHLLVISREAAPYKTDLYNAIARLPDWQITVFYAASKDWAKDGGHDFRAFPKSLFESEEVKGRGFLGHISSTIKTIKNVIKRKPDALIVSGYQGLPYTSAMVLSWLLRIPFFMQVDQFNIGKINWILAQIARDHLRRFVFQNASGIFVCGKVGYESAVLSGCPECKIYDFPYVVDYGRLKELTSETPSADLLQIAEKNKPIILFSGRLIQRKGLPVLLRALKQLTSLGNEFFFVIEGEGPLRTTYENMVHDVGMKENCTFTGFRQMKDHAFLLKIANIIVVPSIRDPWGIVVHEGMLMRKPVCSSDNVGCAVDRIQSGTDGFLFSSENYEQLARQLQLLLSNKDLRNIVGENAHKKALRYSPERNAQTFVQAYKKAADK